ncbi:hypothetical protein Cpir12675_001083 [Ceratocystis pirilliformis]|uniref:Glucose-methanol-choline oxidoreductase N-terminal domain-containing protein n=1 Tax=Ceratocystis pirilliformis TaxID=259994 RepID=A0ABR3ZIF0_9PEZI
MSASSPTYQPSFDYVIVGGGTAGVAVAARLSEDPNVSVLVVEAGDDRTQDPLVLTPGLVAGLYGKDEYDWNFMSPPQASLQSSESLNGRVINQARGRMLGGSSALNFTMAVYPSKRSIDSWANLGNDGWDFDHLAPYLRKFASTSDPGEAAVETIRCESYYDGEISEKEAGPVKLAYSNGYGRMNSAWMDVFERLDLKMTSDPRSGTAIGAFQQPATINPETRERMFSANSYLTPEVRARPNLTVMTNSLVSKVVLDKGEDRGEAVATGVMIRGASGHVTEVKASKEVILAAGTLQSPQILELSGIGGKGLLDKHNITVIVDNPNVGERVQDHPIVCQSMEVVDGINSSDVLRDPVILGAAMATFQDGGKGPLGESIISTAFVPAANENGLLPVETRKEILDKYVTGSDPTYAEIRSIIESEKEPAYQMIAFPGQTNMSPKPASLLDIITPAQPETCVTIMTILNHPFSRGTCHIVSPDVAVKPEWDPRYNSNPADMEILARGVQFARNLMTVEPLRSIFKAGGKCLPNITGNSLEDAKEVVSQRQISVFHVSGSCAMMPREKGGVVDSKLRVYGTKNLRVVDASVFPVVPLGNIQTTVYAVAEKAADIIKLGA